MRSFIFVEKMKNIIIHTFIFIKEMLRYAKTIHKIYIGYDETYMSKKWGVFIFAEKIQEYIV